MSYWNFVVSFTMATAAFGDENSAGPAGDVETTEVIELPEIVELTEGIRG